MSTKAGARNSAKDQSLIQAAHDAIAKAGASCGDMTASKAMALDEQVNAVRDAIYSALEVNRAYDSGLPYPYIEAVYDDYVIVKIGIACYQVSYTLADTGVTFADPSTWTLVEQAWTAKASGAKAGMVASQSTHHRAVVKAVADGDEWTLDVLGAPYGGPKNGRDSHGEYFSASTKFHEDKFALPPVVYYHGYDPASNKPAGEPQFIGATVKRWTDAAGVWYRVTLDKASAAAAKVWAAAKRGGAVASSGSMTHLARYARDGQILQWPITELSIWDFDTTGREPANMYAVALPAAKALYARLNQVVPELTIAESTGDPEVAGDATAIATTTAPPRSATKGRSLMDMDEETIKATIAAAIKADREAQAEVARAAVADQERIDTAVKAERVKWEAETAKGRRLPYGETGDAPHQTAFHAVKKYDDRTAGEMAVFIELMNATTDRRKYARTPEEAYKAYAIKVAEDKGDVGHHAGAALKAAGFDPQDALKANEVMQSTLTGFGDEWVATGYGTTLWEVIRVNTWVMDMIPSKELPQGVDTWVDPLEGADPTWYKVGQTASENATTKTPDATIPSSQFATVNKTLSAAKAGARMEYSGEFDEDSLIAVAPEIRRKLGVSGAEMLESLVIDGDTTLTATTNINHIAGTPGGTEYYTILDGFRKLALITNSANSVSLANGIASSDFLRVAKLLGVNGKNALDKSKVGFIIDLATSWRILTLIDVKTRDVFTNATLENGTLTNVYGFGIKPSGQFAKLGNGLTNTAGKVDQSSAGANNLYGSLLAVRWDQWKLVWKRHMQFESLRIARADITEFVATMRVGMGYRDTEASAIGFYGNVT